MGKKEKIKNKKIKHDSTRLQFYSQVRTRTRFMPLIRNEHMKTQRESSTEDWSVSSSKSQ